MVDPNAPQGLPPGIPPAGGPAAPGAPAPTNPTTDPNALAAVLEAIMQQGLEQFMAEQQQALGTAVSSMLQQQGNPAGEAAQTMPGAPTPPPMPGEGVQDPALGGASGY
jgi:hypothetical protein